MATQVINWHQKINMSAIFAALLVLIFGNFVYSQVLQSYRAGVVVYKPLDFNSDDNEIDHISNNALNYVDLIRQNGHLVDIMIFPGFGITNIRAKYAEELAEYAMHVGNESDIICEKPTQNDLAKMSCAAKENNIYVVINVVEEDESDYYLTTLGLDTNGSIGFKCRQLRLVNGSFFTNVTESLVNGAYFNNVTDQICNFTAKIKNQLPVPFLVLFDTDFMYRVPPELKKENVIITSAIKNSFPINIGISLYQGFAARYNINLLVSGYYEPNSVTGSNNTLYNNYGGSGIFYSNGTSLVSYKPDGKTQESGRGIVLRGEIPIKIIPSSTFQVQSQFEGGTPTMNFQYLNLSGALNSSDKIAEKCIDPKRCCKFQADVADETISPYIWIMFSNKTMIADKDVDVVICALFLPPENVTTSKTLRNISVDSFVDQLKVIQSYPLAVGRDLLPVNYQFNRVTNSTTLEEGDVLVLGILHVVFPDISEPAPNPILIAIITLLCVGLVGLMVMYCVWKKKQERNRRAI